MRSSSRSSTDWQPTARLHQLTPGEDRQHAPATRAAAAALAKERLPQGLRATPYALRHGADSASLFARRIAGAPTQDARDELARSRAVAVKVAQTPANTRPPIAPARRGRDGTKYRRAEARRAEQRISAPDQTGQATRPSRARSQTIAMLRARRQQGDAETE